MPGLKPIQSRSARGRQQGSAHPARTLAVLLGGLAILSLGSCLFVGWSGSRALSSARATLEARGEPLSFEQLVPPELPDDQNFFADPAFAELADVREIRSEAGVRLEPRKPRGERALDCFEVFTSMPGAKSIIESVALGSMPDRRLTDGKQAAAYLRASGAVPPRTELLADADEVLAGLSNADDGYALIDKLAQRPGARFPVDYARRPPLPMPHYEYLIRLAKFYQLRASARMAVADGIGAMRDLFVILRFADALVTEPLIHAQLVRCDLLDNATNVIWEGIERRTWLSAQLAEIADRLSQCWVLSDLGFALRGERTLLDHSPQSNPLLALLPRGVVDADRACTELAIQDVIDTVEAGTPSDVRSYVESAIAHQSFTAVKHPISAATLPSLARYAERFAQTQARIEQARVACELEQYHIVHGDYPESLESLRLQSSRNQPSGGQIHYRPLPGSDYVIWNNGWDGVNDTATPGRDWVWQRSAAW